ncbi:FkbM family methyltransferase [Roseomonas ludipueritiae]|uniref:FkbM family methyltransferase n=1 Tax=Pseudoroseomonas ludipueritiae TaxID=198093 RepID=A0ABR7RDQ8_9PROT|nr:FkbM family methyltransferase [Pseudoroseomonas ludipueritiae]MBC9179652.1 FkbM family methyltransferase [Pseudoroseomonas ludipueritiae]
MMPPPERVETPLWRGGRARRVIETAFYPLFWALNRPAAAGVSRAIYDFALRCNGVAINFPGRHGLNSAEERFLRSIAPALQRGVLLDVGANMGCYAAYLRELAPEATIYAFEPHPATFARMSARLSPQGVRTMRQALSDRAGVTQLFDFEAQDGSTQASLSRAAVEIFDSGVVGHEVTSTTLDSFLDAEGIQEVAFLKVDTEGFDLKVLQGAARAIREKRIRLLQFEFIPANIATHVTMRDFFEALPGYDIYRMCLNGELLPLFPYDVKYCEIYVTQNLIAKPR